MVDWLVAHGSYALLFLALIVAGFGVPIPEEIVLVAAGALASKGVTQPALTVIVCVVGVLGSDIALFLIARRLGDKAYAARRFARLLPPARRAKLDSVVKEHGMRLVFWARLIPGVRAPVFIVAGAQKMPFLRFLACDVIALCISAPIWLGLGYYFTDKIERAGAWIMHAEHFIMGCVVAAIVVGACVWYVRRSRRRAAAEEAAHEGSGPA